MRWQERNVGVWLIICVAVLVGSAFYFRSLQLAQDQEFSDSTELEQEQSVSTAAGLEEEALVSQGQGFYVEQRLERDRARSKEIAVLTEIIDNPDSDKTNRDRAQERLILLGEKLAAEAELEGLIKARGFSDTIVYLHPDSVQVVIKATDLTAEEVALIGDIVAKGWQIPLEKIIIDSRP